MLIVRGTKKLRDRIKTRPAEEGVVSTTALGDWFATALFWRPQVALLVNERTFVPVFMPLAPAATLLDRTPEAIATVLRRHGAAESVVAAELDAMSDNRIAPTNSRSVVGVMTDIAFHGEIRYVSRINDLVELSLDLARMPVGPLRTRTGAPDRELAAVLGHDLIRVAAHPIAPPTTSPQAGSGVVYQIKVTLLDTKPPIWRRILVAGASTLDQLHESIQAAFGWWNFHLHEFEVEGTRYGIPDPDSDYGPPTQDERRTRLDTIANPGSSFHYTYDFGDSWEHKIVVEKVLDASSVTTVPACIDGRRACPPEDCGGTWGYRDLLAILADPTHPQARRTRRVGRGHGSRQARPRSVRSSGLRRAPAERPPHFLRRLKRNSSTAEPP
jgi:hypothetical protein